MNWKSENILIKAFHYPWIVISSLRSCFASWFGDICFLFESSCVAVYFGFQIPSFVANIHNEAYPLLNLFWLFVVSLLHPLSQVLPVLASSLHDHYGLKP